MRIPASIRGIQSRIRSNMWEAGTLARQAMLSKSIGLPHVNYEDKAPSAIAKAGLKLKAACFYLPYITMCDAFGLPSDSMSVEMMGGVSKYSIPASLIGVGLSAGIVGMHVGMGQVPNVLGAVAIAYPTVVGFTYALNLIFETTFIRQQYDRDIDSTRRSLGFSHRAEAALLQRTGEVERLLGTIGKSIPNCDVSSRMEIFKSIVGIPVIEGEERSEIIVCLPDRTLEFLKTYFDGNEARQRFPHIKLGHLIFIRQSEQMEETD